MKKFLSLTAGLLSVMAVQAADTLFIKAPQVPILIERNDNVLFYMRMDAKETKTLSENIFGKQVRITRHIVAHTKERGFYIIIIEQIEDPRRYLRYRSVVERKIYGLLLAGNTPYRFRNQHPVKIGWLFYKHNLKKKRRDGTADLIDTANRISASPLF